MCLFKLPLCPNNLTHSLQVKRFVKLEGSSETAFSSTFSILISSFCEVDDRYDLIYVEGIFSSRTQDLL